MYVCKYVELYTAEYYSVNYRFPIYKYCKLLQKLLTRIYNCHFHQLFVRS